MFGIKMAMEQAQQIRAMGAIFPMIFFAIAALITWTTMNRLVESQRLQIGGMFALGYTRPELLLHYAGYGMLLAVLGLLIGLAGARWALAPIIMRFLTAAYAFPDAVPRLSLPASLAVGAALTVMTGGASMLSARAALSQAPASLMRPKPPGRGRRIMLENIKWLWRRIPFSEKMILRNMFRSPVRLFMGLAGAIGCSALILTGFGLRDSVDYVLVSHYTRTMHYDMRVSFSPAAAPGYAKAVALRAGAAEYEEEMITAAEVHTPEGWRMKQLYILEDGHDMIRLRDEKGAPLTLPARGIALTNTAAEDLGLGIGGTLLLRYPGGRTVEAKVEQIVDLQLNQGVYMTRSAWQKLDLSPFMPTHALLRGGPLQPGSVIEEMEGVSTARTLPQERDTGTATLQIMNVIVVLLVLFSGALELVVFYNLGQLNFSERIRELATLKVLGFTRREMKKLVLRENIIITLMGLPLGLMLGPPLLQLLLTYGLPNTIQFVSYITQASWLYTVGITIVFAFLVNIILGAKFKSVNMVEALKSVE
ncbi:MAG: FtsX-like permease family protein [Clostridiales bacterium]|nr:FtsX-like permease family protein [Clostridiales bacterium]